MIDKAGQQYHDYGRGQIEQPAGDHRSYQQRSRTDRRNFVTAQNVGFPLEHGAETGAEKAIAEYANDENHGDNSRDHSPGSHELSESEKEDERKNVIEEKDVLLAQCEFEMDADQGGVSAHHSRSLFPVNSRNTSSSVGRFK